MRTHRRAGTFPCPRHHRDLAQRDIDVDFHSLFIANKSTPLTPFDETAGLTEQAGHTLTFGSETSTSGRFMPQ